MAFISEWVSEEDIEKYNLRERNRSLHLGVSGRYAWTVDKERDIYLRHITSGRDSEPTDDRFFDFYWRGHLVYVHLGSDDGGVLWVPGAPAKVIWTLRDFQLPSELEAKRIEILEDLKMALVGYGSGSLLLFPSEFAADFKNFN
jgi:hypothetical protein